MKNKDDKKIIVKQLELFKSFSKLVSSTRDMDEILISTVDLIKNLLSVERCSILLVDEETNCLKIKAAAGIPKSEWKKVKIPIGESIAGKVAQSAKPLLIKDIASSKNINSLKKKNNVNYKNNSFISVPMINNCKVIGVINVNNKNDGDTFNDNDLELITALASLVSLVIDNCCVFISTEKLQFYLHSILDNLIVGVIVLDKNHKIDFYNEIIKTFLGFKEKDDLKGRLILDIFEEEESTKLHAAIDKCLEFNETVLEEIIFQNKKGEVKTLGITISQLKMVINPRVEIVLIVEDIAIKKELVELKKLAEFKSNIISIVSHELRTPLTSIRGSVHLIKMLNFETLDTNHQNLVNIIDRNIGRLNDLISDLLDVIHIENRTLPLRFEIIDIESIIRKMITDYDSNIQNKNLDVKFLVKGNSKPLFIDRDKISKAFVHLFDNAIKFTPQNGNIWIELDYKNTSTKIIIKDSGVGIQEKLRNKIFEKLYQVDDTMTREKGGTGLGLFIVKSIIDLHGGSIRINEKWNKGAEFDIVLPNKKSLKLS